MEPLHEMFSDIFKIQNAYGKYKYYQLLETNQGGDHIIFYEDNYYRKLKVHWDLTTNKSYLPFCQGDQIIIFPL